MPFVTETIHSVGNAHLIATYADDAPSIGNGINPQFADVSVQINGNTASTLGKVFITKPADFETSSLVENWKSLLWYATGMKRKHQRIED